MPADLEFWRSDILATGPLTNVANALGRKAPINSVTWMGGSLRAGGNISDFAEFNAYCDPEAAEVVLNSGIECSIIPLDVTTAVPLTIYDVKRLEAVGPAAAAFVTAGRFLLAANQQGECAYLHDAVAAVALDNPGLFGWEQHALACDTSNGERRGETTSVAGGSGRLVNVAVEVNVEAVHDAIMTAVLAALAVC
jgi:inosine-uridine nucleoside N-ribohydrolase